MDAPDRQRVGVALLLSVALAVAAGLLDFGPPALSHEEQVTLHAFEAALDEEEGLAHAVSHGAPFELLARSALAVEIARERATGWVGVLIALVPQGDTDADVRDVAVELMDGDPVALAHFSEVAPGTYRVRLEGAVEGPSDTETVSIRVTSGRRTPWPLLAALLLVWAPALLGLVRTRRSRRHALAEAPRGERSSVPSSADS